MIDDLPSVSEGRYKEKGSIIARLVQYSTMTVGNDVD